VDEAGTVVMLLTLELEVELGVAVTELTRTSVLVMVVVEVKVVVSSAATNGAATKQREAMMAVNFILRIDLKVNIKKIKGIGKVCDETLMREV
jgi:hypothetical protein